MLIRLTDGDGTCDDDDDGDGIQDDVDQCPFTPEGVTVNATGCTDTDGDGVPDSEDCCPNDPNPDQEDQDGDGEGDVCDDDDDGDGVQDDLAQLVAPIRMVTVCRIAKTVAPMIRTRIRKIRTAMVMMYAMTTTTAMVCKMTTNALPRHRVRQ